MLEGRDKLSLELQRIIDARAKPWGIDVISVELKDVPDSSRPAGRHVDAGAGRARAAGPRDLGDSERQVANSFNAAAKMYADNPIAFHLRAMNMLYPGLKPTMRPSLSCPRPRLNRCNSAACRRWRPSPAPSPMRSLRGRLESRRRRQASDPVTRLSGALGEREPHRESGSRHGRRFARSSRRTARYEGRARGHCQLHVSS